MIERLKRRLALGLSLLLPVTVHSVEVSIVVLPDTQNYVELYPEILESQINWIDAQHGDTENIIYVAHLGDLKDGDFTCDNHPVFRGTGEGRTEWQIVDEAYDVLDDANIAYGVLPGNHDFDTQIGGPRNGRCSSWDDEQPLSLYNQHFGPDRFAGKTFYGDPVALTPGNRVPESNEDNFALFESEGVKFIAINLAYKQEPDAVGDGNPELCWTDNLLHTYPDRIGILISHNLLQTDATLGNYGQKVYDELSHNQNLFMMLNGHHLAGEAWLTETAKRGEMPPVQMLLANYQDYPFPGDGDAGTPPDLPDPTKINWANISGLTSKDSGLMRIMRFDTETRMVEIETFIPPETVIRGRTQTLKWPEDRELVTSDADMGSKSASNLTFSFADYAKTYEIGQTGPAGGIVFYVTAGGSSGLEAAPPPGSLAPWLAPWSCYSNPFDPPSSLPIVEWSGGVSGTAVGTGAQNTADIVESCVTMPDFEFAAKKADEYTLNGFDDWFLPSKDALRQMYLNIGQGSSTGNVGGLVKGMYWSSTEYDIREPVTDNLLHAWAMSTGSGGTLGWNAKWADGFLVRPVRAFGSLASHDCNI